MKDPWKYLAFPAAGVTGYLISLGLTSYSLGAQLGLPDITANVLVVGVSGLLAGFMIDEVIPAYIEKVRGSDSGGGMDDMDMGGDDDFDFE